MPRDRSPVAINNHSLFFKNIYEYSALCLCEFLFLCYSSVWLGASTSRTINPERVEYCKTTTCFLVIPIFVLSLFWESKRKLQAQQECVKARATRHRARRNYLLNRAVRDALFILAKARGTTLNGEIQRDGLSLLFILARNGLLFNVIHELVWVYFIEHSEQNKCLHA